MNEVYIPEEDSFFLSEVLKSEIKKIKKTNIQKLKFLEIGVGSGIQLEIAFKSGIKREYITGVDINNNSVFLCREKGFNVIKSNLFSKIGKKESFNIIIFNPPYLPESKFDVKKDTSGGKKGNETIINFLKQSKNHLEKDGFILLLTSSFTPKVDFKKLGYNEKVLQKKKLFFEELYIHKLNMLKK